MASAGKTTTLLSAGRANGRCQAKVFYTREPHADAERELGAPVSSSDRHEGSLLVTTVVFVRGDERITAEFVEDVLVRTFTSK